MLRKRLELSLGTPNMHLKHARLPIPPPERIYLNKNFLPQSQLFFVLSEHQNEQSQNHPINHKRQIGPLLKPFHHQINHNIRGNK